MDNLKKNANGKEEGTHCANLVWITFNEKDYIIKDINESKKIKKYIDINKDNQLKNKKLEEENKNLILKMKEMEQMIINKNIINDKNEIKEIKSGKGGSIAERNEIGVKIIPIKTSSKK